MLISQSTTIGLVIRWLNYMLLFQYQVYNEPLYRIDVHIHVRVMYLNLARNLHVSSLFLSFRQNEIGTPYCIIADGGTLETGIVALHDRNTTVQVPLGTAHMVSPLRVIH